MEEVVFTKETLQLGSKAFSRGERAFLWRPLNVA